MSSRGPLACAWAATIVLLLVLVPSGASAGEGTLTVPGVTEVQVPDLPDVPDVPGVVTTPDLNETVDPVVDQVDDAVNGGAAPAPQPSAPAPADPAPSSPSSGGSASPDASAPVADPGTGASGGPASDPSSGGKGKQGSGGSGDGGGGDTAGAAPGAATGAGPAADQKVAQRTASTEGGGSLPARIGEFIADLPTGVLIGLFGLAVIALLMTGRSAWFARATRRLNRQRRSLQRDVGALQAALVPELPADVGGVGVSVAYRPAAGPAAGGDFHDVFELADGRIGIVVGDVAGHGREALPRTGVMRYTIRAYLEAGLEPRIALRLTDRALGDSFDGDFASAVAATYEPATRRLVYSCAGHPQPIVVGGERPDEVDVLAAPPIGIGHPSGSRQTTLALDPGCELWLFTDGLIEAPAGEGMLGREGLRALLDDQPDAAALLDRIAAGGEVRDDLTVCRLQPPEPAEAPQPFSVEALLVEHTYGDEEITQFLVACGLEGEELDAVREKVEAERRREGQVLIRISRLDSVMHWRVERVESHLGRTAAPVDGAVASPLAS